MMSQNLSSDAVVIDALRIKSKEFDPSRSKFFPIREVPFMKRGIIDENHFSLQ